MADSLLSILAMSESTRMRLVRLSLCSFPRANPSVSCSSPIHTWLMTESDRCAVSQSAQSSNEPSVAYSTVSGTQSPAQAASVSSTPVLGIVPTSESVTPSPNVGSNDTSVTDLDATMQRILHLAEEADGQCRICWVNGQVGQRAFHVPLRFGDMLRE